MTHSAARPPRTQPEAVWNQLADDLGRAARPLDEIARSDRAATTYSVTRSVVPPGLADRCEAVIASIRPHEIIYRPETCRPGAQGPLQAYLLRWHLRPKQSGRSEHALYLHRFLQPDHVVLHDHPWPSASWLLSGAQCEVWKPHGGASEDPQRRQLIAGSLVCRPAVHAHCLGLSRDEDGRWRPATTLFATGRRIREWGFWPEGRFVPEAEYQSQLPAAARCSAA